MGIGFGLWIVAMALLAAHSGIDGTLAQMGWFFTKAALLTFGGAFQNSSQMELSAVLEVIFLSSKNGFWGPPSCGLVGFRGLHSCGLVGFQGPHSCG